MKSEEEPHPSTPPQKYKENTTLQQTVNPEKNSPQKESPPLPSSSANTSAMKQKLMVEEEQQQYELCIYCDNFYLQSELPTHQPQCLKILEEAELMLYQSKMKCQHCSIQLSVAEQKFHEEACPMKMMKCYKCGQLMLKCILEEHLFECNPSPQEIKCTFCNQMFPNNLLQEHLSICKNKPQPKEEVKPPEKKSDNFNFCLWCQSQVNSEVEGSLEQHEEHCPDYIEHRTNIKTLSKEVTPLQLTAIDCLYQQSIRTHHQNMYQVQNRIFEMGYTEDDKQLMLKFIQIQAPIIIHFNMSRLLAQFVQDTRYRNLFETHTSQGSNSTASRKRWEEHLFGEHYSNAADEERVKYGVMNFSNDHKGVKSCSQYGSSYMVLNYDVRRRCTISDKRKYGAGEIVATFKYCNAVLSKFQNKELQAIFLSSKGYGVESQDLQYFKEIHIHGPIYFGRDVEIVYGPKDEIEKNKQTVLLFEETFGVPVKAIEDNFM